MRAVAGPRNKPTVLRHRSKRSSWGESISLASAKLLEPLLSCCDAASVIAGFLLQCSDTSCALTTLRVKGSSAHFIPDRFISLHTLLNTSLMRTIPMVTVPDINTRLTYGPESSRLMTSSMDALSSMYCAS